MLDHIPLYLGVPSTVEDKLVFDKLGIIEYYGIKPAKIDHYVMYAVLDNGMNVDVEVHPSNIRLGKDLVQAAIDERYTDIPASHIVSWLTNLYSGPRRSIADFSLILRVPGLYEATSWCTRWPSEDEVKSMLRWLDRFSISIGVNDFKSYLEENLELAKDGIQTFLSDD